MKNFIKGMLLSSSLAMSCMANATLVTQWEYIVSSQWLSADFTVGDGDGDGTVSQDASVISWGGTQPYTNQDASSSVARSALVISNSPAGGTNMFTGSGIPALTNIITHWNNVISGSFRSLLGATLKTTLQLKPFAPVEAEDFFPPVDLDFTIKFTETPNNGSCVDISTSNCDDIFVITFGSLDESFVYDGINYNTSIVELTQSLTGLSDEACAEAGAAAGCLGFLTTEKDATSAQFGILIDAVPEPAGIATFGLGIIGLLLYGRRRTLR